jgi:hypothetical protein
VHSSVKDGPGYSSRVLSLQEEGFCLAILKSEDLAVTTNIELSLYITFSSAFVPFIFVAVSFRLSHPEVHGGGTDLARVDLGTAEGIVVGTHLGCRRMGNLIVELMSS